MLPMWSPAKALRMHGHSSRAGFMWAGTPWGLSGGLACGQVHHVRVKGGPNGYAEFVRDIQSIFGITAEHDMQLAFDCADPITGEPQHQPACSRPPRPAAAGLHGLCFAEPSVKLVGKRGAARAGLRACDYRKGPDLE